MLNYFIAQEAIASTEIEIGPFSDLEKMMMLFYLTSYGDLSMKEAKVIVEEIMRDEQENTA